MTKMTNKKMTKREMFGEVREILNGVGADVDLIAFVEHEIELLERKANTSAQSKTQKENEPIKAAIVEYLGTQTELKSITDMIKGSPQLGDYTNQKISALVKQLVEEKQLKKITEKGKSLFGIRKES